MAMIGALLGAVQCARAQWEFSTLRVRLEDSDGKPVAGYKILLVGVSRDSWMEPDQAAQQDGWNFLTDGQGVATVHFGRFAATERHEKEKVWLPGWGEYHLVVERAVKHGGAVSPLIVNRPPGSGLPSAGRWGAPFVLGAGQEDFLLKLRPGITVTGKVQDLSGNPLPDLAFSLYHELGTNSVVEIFRQDARSDRHGFFEFRQVHPAPFRLSLETSPPYWIQTRLGGQWQDGIQDEFEPQPRSREVLVGIVVSPKKIYRYFGQVKDNRGKTVENAKVILAVSEHRRAHSFRDKNNYIEVMTDAEGRYDVQVETPWVLSITVEAAGCEKRDLVAAEGETLKPGMHNFSLKRAS